MTIPSPLDIEYCVAGSPDIRSWSFGSLKWPSERSASSADNIPGTLHDQRIFGPICDFKCACGKYVGDRYKNMICDQCGVKLALSDVRSSRFGHIEFRTPVDHPFASDVTLHCFPVLPIRFIESPAGQRLFAKYDELISIAATNETSGVREAIESIINHLIAGTVTLHNWRIATAETFARGMALKQKSSIDDLW